MAFKSWLQDHVGDIFTTLGCVGLGLTVHFAIDETRKESEPPKKKTDTIKTHPKTIVSAVASAGCFLLGAYTEHRKNIMLSSAYATVVGGYDYYKERSRMVAGDEIHKRVMETSFEEAADRASGNPPWDETQTFYIYGQKEYFERTMLDVIRAEYMFDRYWVTHDNYATLNDMYDFFNLPPIKGGDNIGWDLMSGEAFKDYCWIDFRHRHYVTDEGFTVCSIELVQEPAILDLTRKKQRL